MARPRLRSLAAQSLTYGLGGFASRVVGFFLVPVYVAYAGRAAFGIVELVTAAITASAAVLRLGTPNSMSRFTLGDAERDDWAPVIHTIFGFVMGMSTAAVLAGFALLGPLAAVLGTTREVTAIGLIGLWVTINYDVVQRVYRIERRARAFVAYSLLNIAVTVALTLWLVVVRRERAVGLMAANFGGSLLVYALLLIARCDTIGLRRFDRGVLREVLH